MSYRNALFRNRLRYTFLPVYAVGMLVVISMALAATAFQVVQERRFLGLIRENLSCKLANTYLQLSSLPVNHNFSSGNESTALSRKLLECLKNNHHIKAIALFTPNHASSFTLTREGNLQEIYMDSTYAAKRYDVLKAKGSAAIYFRLGMKSLNVRLKKTLEGEVLGCAIAEISLPLPGRIRVEKEHVNKWIDLKSDTSGESDWIDTINGFLDIKRAKIYIDTFFIIIAAGLILLVILVAYAWFSSKAMGRELMLCANSLNSADDELLNNGRGELVVAVRPIIIEARLRLNQLTDRLVECRDRLDRFYQASADAIVVHRDGVTLFFNPAFTELTGYSEQELGMFGPFKLIKVDEELLREVREGWRPSAEATLRRSDGKVLYVEIQAKSVTYRGQKAETIVIRDITHRKFMERELQQERMRQVKSVIDGQEKERQRLSRELHDGLGQNLVAIKLKLESIPHEVAGEFNATLVQVKQMFNHTIDEVRRISNNLMPAALKEFSLAVVLRNLCNEVEGNSGISISLTVGVLPEPLDQLLKTYVYRIVQEALTNVIKHSGASRANVTVYADFSNLHLQIEDNGVGFAPTHPADTGNGLYNMKERAILLNGKINFISSPGKGTKIVADFPLKQTNSIENGQN